jgi:hypothetical protein
MEHLREIADGREFSFVITFAYDLFPTDTNLMNATTRDGRWQNQAHSINSTGSALREFM